MKKRQYFIVDGKKIPTTKNVKYAAKKLPPEVQNLFLEIWKLIGCMDLYGGYLPDYFQIIKQNIEEYHKKIKKVEEVRNMLVNSLTALLKEKEE